MIDKRGCIHQTIGYCMGCQQWADEHKGKAPTFGCYEVYFEGETERFDTPREVADFIKKNIK